jgi:competence protein ComEC
MVRALLVSTVAVLAACPAPGTPARTTLPAPSRGTIEAKQGEPRITWTRVSTAADLPGAPAPGSYRVHMIDVGTGLAILVQGSDFAMLYDAGTRDKSEKPLRVVAYLAAVLGASGDDLCVEPRASVPTERRRVENVVLSHPHEDHASALDLVIHCYDVGTFWDSGRVHETKVYRELLAAIARTSISYRSAADLAADRVVKFKAGDVALPRWQGFSEGDRVELGAGAAFTVLHVNAKGSGSPNIASIVLAVELGRTKVLLTGDAESGERADPSYPPGETEEYLLEHHAKDIRSDILQVGHHGSKTSSRHDFIAGVAPRLALVSSGPFKYSSVVLPDVEVLEELTRAGATVLRTDERDDNCPVRGRIGGDKGPGGCDTWVITIEP